MEAEPRLVDLESGKCVCVERHVYPQTVVSVSQLYKDPTDHIGLVQSGHHHHHLLIKK